MRANRLRRATVALAVGLLVAGAAQATIDFSRDCEGYTIDIYTTNQLPPGASASGQIVVQLTSGGVTTTCSEPIVLTADANGVVDVSRTVPWCFDLDGTYTISAAIAGGGQSYPVPVSRDPLVCECSGRIGDFVWNDGIVDQDCDGIQPGDMTSGINGVEVCLLDDSGATVACTTTQEVTIGGELVGGYYEFTGLCADDYTVVVATPDGFVPAPSFAGSDTASDSNGSPAGVSLPGDESTDTTIDFGYCTSMGGGEGCTPGYWKNHEEDWVGYETDDRLGDVFTEVRAYGGYKNLTLLEALQTGPEPGNVLLQSVRNLMRIATASLLSAAHGDVDFGATPAMVIAQVNAALATANATTIQNLKNDLDRQNNSGCPL